MFSSNKGNTIKYWIRSSERYRGAKAFGKKENWGHPRSLIMKQGRVYRFLQRDSQRKGERKGVRKLGYRAAKYPPKDIHKHSYTCEHVYTPIDTHTYTIYTTQ